ncbi:PfkB family carbohydrate kinase [Herbiconiux sp.]|uniref:PfkB family carbohydrate kinase n=1 Tax=Herbiconiux sp. TaxID=1871186 RepID=UPI0025C68CFA|nr:PfkB family carbohydrate kinase [Herbiconiux sp.]
MQMQGDGLVLVAGQVARDLVLLTEGFPADGGSTRVGERRELLGGKGANQAVGWRQLGAEVALLAVIGTDREGDDLLGQLEADGIRPVVARRGTTGLLTDIVGPGGSRRLFERVPEESLLRPGDLAAVEHLLPEVDTLCLQLQQPLPVLFDLARRAHDLGIAVALDGGVSGPGADELLALASIVRADAVEAEQLTGFGIASPADARAAAKTLLDRGADVVALTVGGEGDLVVWPGGERFVAFGTDETVVDPTGAGDAFSVGLVAGLRAGLAPEDAASLAADAARSTVARPGGRPDLTALRERLG